MRTARTIGIKADGSEVILHPATVPVAQQLAEFREASGKPLPKGYAEIHLQTNDGRLKSLRASTHVSTKEAEARAKDKLDNAEKYRKAAAEARDKEAKARAAERQKQIDKANEAKEALKKKLRAEAAEADDE